MDVSVYTKLVKCILNNMNFMCYVYAYTMTSEWRHNIQTFSKSYKVVEQTQPCVKGNMHQSDDVG